jgi:hypothetical protein
LLEALHDPTPHQLCRIAAQDLARLKAFYAAAFGWMFRDWGPDYASFGGAGLEGGEAPAAGSTTVILYADDRAAAERAVVKAGGVIGPRHEFPGGRRFHCADPYGKALAVRTKSTG